MKKTCLLGVLLLGGSLFGNELTGSFVSEYYDGLALLGKVERPYMNYRALSTNSWPLPVEHLWQSRLREKRSLLKNQRLYIEGFNLYQSYNHRVPYGMNDGGLWQGKGYNLALQGGMSFYSPSFEVTLVPEFFFSQNRSFPLASPDPWSGSEFGYPSPGIDAPQRMGSEAYIQWGLGQSQVRFRYKNFSLGGGTENIWIGPGVYNALVLSNNAEGFPHVDFGVDKSVVKVAGKDLGWTEFKMFWGALKSSAFYERSSKEAYRDFLTGFSFSYSFPFLPELTLGVHQVVQIPFESMGVYGLVAAIDFTTGDYNAGTAGTTKGDADTRTSLTWSWLFPEVRFEFYGELAREDNSKREHWFTNPQHTLAFVLGVKQAIPLGDGTFFRLIGEYGANQFSRNYFIAGWGPGYYRHYTTNLGYANEGQILGAGMGTGSDYQKLALDYFIPEGMVGLYFARQGLDDTEIYKDLAAEAGKTTAYPTHTVLGVRGGYLLKGTGLILGGELAYVKTWNWNRGADWDFQGFHGNLMANYRF